MSAKSLKDYLAFCYGGLAAEQVVFGKEMVGSGGTSDIEQATEVAGQMVKEMGLESFSSLICDPSQANGRTTNSNDSKKVNNIVESLCTEARNKAIRVISENTKVLIEISNALIKNSRVSSEELVELLKKFNIEAKIPEIKEKVPDNYSELYEKFYAYSLSENK
jgi:ATP-dependent Zn protease